MPVAFFGSIISAMDAMDPPRPSTPASVGSPPNVPWGLRDLLFGSLAAAVGVIALNLILLATGLVTLRSITRNGDTLALFVALQDLTVVGAAALFSLVRYHAGWETLGLRSFDRPLGCGLSVRLLAASYGVRICYGMVALAFGYQPALQDVLSQLDTQGIGFVLTLVAAAVIAPIAEELFFRGFLYGGLRKRVGVPAAMAVSTLLFTALHFTLDQFIPIFVLGLFLAWLYEKSGSLFPGIMLHSANNAISLILFALLKAMGGLPGI
ncbi:MAG: CPBP family intramembrane metalloprotease [Chloroflexi bacterium]|nr:CPBP family intramembrane metalloprotease [Chloroflexota bacterium]